MDNAFKYLERSIGLVKTWGQSPLPSGKTLTEGLKFQGLSLWEVILPTLALYYVPKALSSGLQPSSFMQHIRPYLSLAKHTTLDFIKHKRNRQACQAWPAKPAVLFLGFSSYMYRDVLQPVVDRLAGNKAIETVTIHDEERARKTTSLLMDSVAVQSIWQHWDDEVKSQILVLRQELRAAIAELQSTNALSRIIQAEGESLWPQLQNAFNWLFRFHLPFLLPYVAVARHILKRHRPKLIISCDVADPSSRLYCLLGRQMDIPSLEIQFGPCGTESVEWRFFLADRVAAWGEGAREALLSHGVSVEQITITGSPRHDCMVNVSSVEVARTRARLGISPGTAMVLCASSYQTKEYDGFSDPALLISMKQAVFQAAEKVAGLFLVVKPHPWEDVRETKHLIGQRRNLLLVDSFEDIRELTKACDAFVSFGTTATVDALIANKLIICPAFQGWVWCDWFLKSGAALVPSTAEEVVQSFQMVVDGSRGKVLADLEPARQQFLRQLVYKTDGQSSARVEEMVWQMIQQMKPK